MWIPVQTGMTTLWISSGSHATALASPLLDRDEEVVAGVASGTPHNHLVVACVGQEEFLVYPVHQ